MHAPSLFGSHRMSSAAFLNGQHRPVRKYAVHHEAEPPVLSRFPHPDSVQPLLPVPPACAAPHTVPHHPVRPLFAAAHTPDPLLLMLQMHQAAHILPRQYDLPHLHFLSECSLLPFPAQNPCQHLPVRHFPLYMYLQQLLHPLHIQHLRHPSVRLLLYCNPIPGCPGTDYHILRRPCCHHCPHVRR